MVRLPVVVASSVIRSSTQGESHGGVYLIDLERERHRQVVDWNDDSISWEGRGADRGLRGIAFHAGHVYLAASDEVFVYDADFHLVRSHSNPYLAHCHEIAIDGETLFLTSTGFDSVLVFDLSRQEFVDGYHLSWSSLSRRRIRHLKSRGDRPVPRLSRFDPRASGGPARSDTCHVNNVHAAAGRVFVSGTGIGRLLEIDGDRLRSRCRIPYGTHNARPFRGGALFNHTAADAVVEVDGRGRRRRWFPIPQHDPDTLAFSDLPGDHARPSFGRGLCLGDGDVLVAGSSPATVTAYDLDTIEVLASVTLTRDVRNAVHGLEVWPFDSTV